MKAIVEWIGSMCATLVWFGFPIIKIWGTTFAAWSYWWMLFPIVPWLHYALIVRLGM